MIVLSLFDGISCGRVALERAGIKVDKYYASEIDKYAIQVAMKNYPDTIQLGDITKIDFKQFVGKIDLIIGGSPCQDLSVAGKREGLKGARSGLFYKFIEAIETIKPRYFLLENNVGMPHEAYEEISRLMGCYPIEINSALVSAQTRKRYYWTNIGHRQYNLFGFPTVDIPQPENKGILLKDILESGLVDNEKSFCITQRYSGQFGSPEYTLKRYFDMSMGQIVAEPIGLGKLKGDTIEPLDKARTVTSYYSTGQTLEHTIKKNIHSMVAEPLKIPENTVKGYAEIQQGECVDLTHINSKTRRGRAMKEKSNCLQTSSQFYQYLCPVRIGHLGKTNSQRGRIYSVKNKSVALNANTGGMSGKKGLYKIDLPDGDYIIRKLTPLECERLQTLPDNYTEGISNSQRYKCIGNGWTVDVIKHIFSFLPENFKK